ncbi:tyrosine-protein phosphatase [Gorillibacterium sp. sgz5001074]|uniref:tyrosine-protein phosphatase n=1 Tax=Gorillibacterium sp. sgz5001074 TaxID=3446695 RepID=UPI003F66B8CA
MSLGSIPAASYSAGPQWSNFRDAAVPAARGGCRMQSGILFRSGELSSLKGKDLARLEETGIRLIIDLRTPNERRKKGIRFLPGREIKVVSIPFCPYGKDYTPGEMVRLLLRGKDEQGGVCFMEDFYRGIGFDSPDQVRQVMELLAEESNVPALVHCTGGKDRTGFITAILQLLLGLPRPVVLEHYMLSNGLIASRMRRIERMARWLSLFRLTGRQLRPILEVRREYLDGVLDELLARYGSAEGYLTEYCGVHPETVEKLRRNLSAEGKGEGTNASG